MGKKIAVFDSGLGGITVLSELRKLMPTEEYVYYGDSANAPYGGRTDEELLELCTRLCTELSTGYDIKCFVAACNTTTSRIFRRLASEFPSYPFIGIEPAVSWAVDENPGKNILVLATAATVSSTKLREAISGLRDRAAIFTLAPTEIVPYVEGGGIDSLSFREYLYEILSPYSDTMDAVVLGCTHFPFAREQIRRCFKKDIKFYDGAVLTARACADLLGSMGERVSPGLPGDMIFLNSDPAKISLEQMLLDTYEKRP